MDALAEVKAVKSHFNFYPEHYFAEAIQSDIKVFTETGRDLKNLKKDLEQKLIDLADHKKGSNEAANLRDDITEVTLKALGYFDLPNSVDSSNQPLDIIIDNKSYSVKPTKRVALKGHGEFWIFSTNSDKVIQNHDEALSFESEHFFDHAGTVSFRDQEAVFTWDQIVDGLFDSDSPYADWILIHNGQSLFLVERGKWQQEDAYLELNLLEMYEVNSDSTYHLASALFSPDAFPIKTADFFHEIISQSAHNKASEVTKALRDTVRESIELIANEVMRSHREMPLAGFKEFNLKDPQSRREAANLLFDQSLKYVYRMLFMLFAESQSEAKGALPVHSKAYQRGYAIEKLRDLEVVTLQENSNGNFIQKTLEQAFLIYFNGYHHDIIPSEESKDSLGFSFPSLGTHLFAPEATALINEIKLRDGVMQKVIYKMSVAKTGAGKKARTQRVHYAGLGLNQLGAVYEGLLSLKPEILGSKVALLQRESKQLASGYIAYSKKAAVPQDKLLLDENKNLVVRQEGEFLLTPAGLERKFSASFYTPEILTRFVAKEAVDCLLEKDSSLKKLESLKILEPAMGSGAFLNAVVDELAPRIAQYKETEAKKVRKEFLAQNPNNFEVGPRVESFEYYKLEAKSYLMRNSVYGVDLNPTAVDLAKVSLWLNCLHSDGNLPFMDFKLRLGNSLVGAWVNRNFHHDNVPHWFYPNSVCLDPHINGKILGDKKRPFIKDERILSKLKALKSEFQNLQKNPEYVAQCTSLSKTVETLYTSHIKQRRTFQENLGLVRDPVSKKKLFSEFLQKNTAYNQLRLAMDIWCSLWFWPHDQLQDFPGAREYLSVLKWALTNQLSGTPNEISNQIENLPFKFINISRQVALAEKFFHYDLEYAEVFAEGGFDLVLGNPPWAPVRWEEADFFEECSPGIHAIKGSSKDYQVKYQEYFSSKPAETVQYKNQRTKVEGFSTFLKNSNTYAFNDKSSTNIYRYFYQRFQMSAKDGGIHGMIAQDGILTDDGCVEMRPTFYTELERIYKFKNELRLFEDVHNEVNYAVWFARKAKNVVDFIQIDNLYHPMTITRCKEESKAAPYRGMKNEQGKFELRGHPDRIVRVDRETLGSFAQFEGIANPLECSLPIVHGAVELGTLTRLACHPLKINFDSAYYWRRFDETGAPKAGLIKRKPGTKTIPQKLVMTGPNIFVGNPATKGANATAKNNRDFHDVVLATVPNNFLPDVVYECTSKGLKSEEYNSLTPWGARHTDLYRIFARQMVSTTGARTLSSAIVPPGPTHVNSMASLSFKNTDELVYTSGLFNSLIYDFLMRSISGGMIGQGVYQMTPTLTPEQLQHPLVDALRVRTLRLSAISTYYQPLWKEIYSDKFNLFEISSKYSPELSYSKLTNKWVRNTCIRNEHAREQALCEIDAIVAILFEFSKETLLNLYRSQFGVLQNNLQDLLDQKVDPEEYHFPRYQAMSEAYDQFMKIALTAKRTKRVAS